MDELKDLNGQSRADPAASSSAAASSSSAARPSDPAAAAPPRAPAAAASAASAASSDNQSRRPSDAKRKTKFEIQRERVLEFLHLEIDLYLEDPSSPHVRLSSAVRKLLDQLLRLRRQGGSKARLVRLRDCALALAEREHVLDDGSRWADRMKEAGFAAFSRDDLFGRSSSSPFASRSSAEADWHWGASDRRAPYRPERDLPFIYFSAANEVHIHHHDYHSTSGGTSRPSSRPGFSLSQLALDFALRLTVGVVGSMVLERLCGNDQFGHDRFSTAGDQDD